MVIPTVAHAGDGNLHPLIITPVGDDAAKARAKEAFDTIVADCLDRCDDSNVVLLRPSRAAKRAGGKPLWLGGVLSAAHTELLCGWLRRGGPAVEAPPRSLLGLRLRPARR